MTDDEQKRLQGIGSHRDLLAIPSIIALIPARANSRRVPGKNTRYLGGKPLIAWTINAAKEAGIFERIIVCSDDQECLGIATVCEVDFRLRPPSSDDEPDIVWVKRALEPGAPPYDAFAILRPTSPFRTADTIRRAWQHFLGTQPADSLRAVEPVKQHPGKMWVARGGRILPLLPWEIDVDGTPWHSSATQSLPNVYVQNASLEIAWTKTVTEQRTIAGTNVLPFYTEGYEGFDINTHADFEQAERLLAKGVICRSHT